MDGSQAVDAMKALQKAAKNMRGSLEKMKAEGKENTAAYKKLEKELLATARMAREAQANYVQLDTIMANLGGSTLRELQKGLREAKREMQNLTADDPKMKKLVAQYKAIDNQIGKITGQWKRQDGAIMSVMKRLIAYVGVYGAFNFVRMQMEKVITQNLKFSDTLADIQKTTGMTRTAIGELNEELNKIDTRTSVDEMHKLAYEAGKLGITGVENVRQFAVAANQLVVALGDELGGADAVTQLMKINQVLGVTAELGIEKALLSTGSAMNFLSQSSTATADKMVGFSSRLAGVAAQSKITMAELVGLGGASDALKQEVEVSATAMNKFLVTLQTNTREVAQAVGMSDAALKEMLTNGDTLDAALLVLERLGQKGGLGAIAPLMKDLGSDGARLTAVLSTMSSNIDFVREMVDKSRTSFAKATSVTDEYNVKNENAAALMARLGNSITKMYVNSGFEEWLTNILGSLMNLPHWFDRNYNSIRNITSAIVGLTVAIISYGKAVAVTKTLASLDILRHILLPSVDGLIKLKMALLGVGKTIKVLWRWLRMTIKANWVVLVITTVVGALAALVTHFGLFGSKVSIAAKAVAEFTAKLARERLELQSLRTALTGAKEGTEERTKLIGELNSKYGRYLDFIITESNYLDSQAYIYAKINAELERTLALKMREQSLDKTMEKYGEPLDEASSALYNDLYKNHGTALASQVQAIIERVVGDNLTKGVDEAWTRFIVEVKKVYKNSADHAPLLSTAYDGFRDYFDVRKDMDEEQRPFEARFQAQAAAAEGRSLTATLDQYNKVFSEINKGGGIATATKEQVLMLQDLAQSAAKIDSANLATYNDTLLATSQRLRALNVQTDVWGKGLSLETSSVDDLVAQYKLLFDQRKQVRGDKDYTQVGSPYTSAAAERAALEEQYKSVEAELKRRGYTTSGNLIKTKGGNGNTDRLSGESLVKKQVTAAMDALEEFFIGREKLINDDYLARKITAAEREQQLQDQEQAHLVARIQLRRRLLGQSNEFDKEYYDMEHHDLQQLADFIAKMGGKLSAEMSRKAAEDLLKIGEAQIKRRQEVEEILRQRDRRGTVNHNTQQELERLGLFWNNQDAGTEAEAKERIQLFEQIAAEAYLIEQRGLDDQRKLHQQYAAATERLTSDQQAVLLYKLQQYHDALTEADRKNFEERQRIVEQHWNASGSALFFDSADDTLDASTSDIERAHSAGALSDGSAAQTQMDIVLQQIGLDEMRYQARLEILERTAATEEQFAALEADRSERLQKSRDLLEQHYLSHVRSMAAEGDKWGTAIGEGLGEMIKGTEDAGKTLLKNLAKMALQSLAQMAQTLVMRQAMQAADVASQGASAAATAGIEAGKAAAISAASIASATAQSMAQPDSVMTFGATGIARAAILTGLIGAALAVALASIDAIFPSSGNTSTAEAASASRKTRLSSGMLTYDSGNLQQIAPDRFPVLGDDGRTYQARYAPRLDTGLVTTPTATTVGGRPALVAERGPEIVIGRETTRALQLSHPDLLRTITAIDRHHSGRYRTFDTGNLAELSADPSAALRDALADALAPSLDALTATLLAQADAQQRLNDRLDHPLQAQINKYGAGGLIDETLDGLEQTRRNNLDPRIRRLYR